MRILLVVNSFASSVTARNTVVVHQALSRRHEVQVVETNRRGHATRFAQDAARRGVDVVVGFGGDGTLNEVATGVAGTETALGVLPGGSTNVFARTLGMPNDPVAAVRMLVDGLEAVGSVEHIDRIGLGRVNGRYFCFHTGIGYDAAVVRTVETRASLKRWAGHPLFIYAALRTWLVGYDRHHPHFSVHVPRGQVTAADDTAPDDTAPDDTAPDDTAPDDTVDGYFTVVLNTNPYTYLGNRPLDLSHAATFDRGLVAITFRTMAASAILRSLGGALRGGGVKPDRSLAEHVDLTRLVVDSETPFPYQVDGDYLGETTRLEFAHVPDAVRLVLPA